MHLIASARLGPGLIAASVLIALAGCGESTRRAQSGSHSGHEQKQSGSYARLISRNYKPLSAQQSRRLVRYAARERACLAAHFQVGPLKVSRTRITMAVAGHPDAATLAHPTCAPRVGPPPAGATLQARDATVLVYVPKYCVLDRKVMREGGRIRRRPGVIDPSAN